MRYIFTMGTGSFPGVKRTGRGADHALPSKCRGHERVGLYLYSPSGPSWPVVGKTFTFNEIHLRNKNQSDDLSFLIYFNNHPLFY